MRPWAYGRTYAKFRFKFGGKVGQTVVSGQKCMTNIAGADASATATTFIGTRVCAWQRRGGACSAPPRWPNRQRTG